MASPGLSWDAMLKMSKINLDLISDIDMQPFIEKELRGCISYIAHWHAKANNRYMGDYNPQKESSYLMYLDANNLYDWAMSQPLPYRDFKWLGGSTPHGPPGVIHPSELDFNKYDENSKKESF